MDRYRIQLETYRTDINYPNSGSRVARLLPNVGIRFVARAEFISSVLFPIFYNFGFWQSSILYVDRSLEFRSFSIEVS